MPSPAAHKNYPLSGFGFQIPGVLRYHGLYQRCVCNSTESVPKIAAYYRARAGSGWVNCCCTALTDTKPKPDHTCTGNTPFGKYYCHRPGNHS